MNKSRVGPFALEQPLRRDGKGSVYLAIHVVKRKSVALKVFSAPLVKSQSDIRDEYREEFHKLKRLRHDNIVRCFGGSFDGMEGYVASELVRGETLQETLSRRERFSWESAVETAMPIAAALQFAHEAEIVHGDLTLDKILIDQMATVKVADFRVARHRCGNFVAPSFRQAEDVLYVAPELFEPGTEPTPRSDIYSLGAILYHLLTGEPPHLADDVTELARLKNSQVPERVSARMMDCPIWLDALLTQMLSIDVDQRPYSAAAVTMALQVTKKNVADRTSVAEHAISGISPIKVTSEKDEARKLLGQELEEEDLEPKTPLNERAWFLALCLLVIVGGGLAWLLWPVSDKKLFEKAAVLMESNDLTKWRQARRRYLRPLMERFPDGDYAVEAQEYLDKIDMAVAEEQLKLKVHIRRPRSEGERLYLEALGYEQFGDQATALEKYQSMIKLLADVEEARTYVNLAQRQAQKLLDQDSPVEGIKLVESRLADADALVLEGDVDRAQAIWESIVSLYGNRPEFEELINKAKSKLKQRAKSSNRKQRAEATK